jgi:hypothetical protein
MIPPRNSEISMRNTAVISIRAVSIERDSEETGHVGIKMAKVAQSINS